MIITAVPSSREHFMSDQGDGGRNALEPHLVGIVLDPEQPDVTYVVAEDSDVYDALNKAGVSYTVLEANLDRDRYDFYDPEYLDKDDPLLKGDTFLSLAFQTAAWAAQTDQLGNSPWKSEFTDRHTVLTQRHLSDGVVSVLDDTDVIILHQPLEDALKTLETARIINSSEAAHYSTKFRGQPLRLHVDLQDAVLNEQWANADTQLLNLKGELIKVPQIVTA